MSPWFYFKRILVINLDDRPDRYEQIKTELLRVIPLGVECGDWGVIRMSGVRDEDPVIGFNKAQHHALTFADGQTPVLILEDDCIFHDHEHFEAALSELPEDWDILYLGANIVGTDLCDWPVPEYVSPHLRRVRQAWTTHAVAYSQKGLNRILKDWDYTNDQIYDDYLRCAIEEKLNAYIIAPMIADQRPGFSDIWNRDTHYGFFEQGNEKMKI